MTTTAQIALLVSSSGVLSEEMRAGILSVFAGCRFSYLATQEEDPQMKKLLVLVALLAMAAIPTLAQGPVTGPYLVDYFSNNGAAGADQQVRLVNFGTNGTPLTSPVGDVCANIYVFDANQEM